MENRYSKETKRTMHNFDLIREKKIMGKKKTKTPNLFFVQLEKKGKRKKKDEDSQLVFLIFLTSYDLTLFKREV